MKKHTKLTVTAFALLMATTGMAQYNLTSGASTAGFVLRYTNSSLTAPTAGSGLLYDNASNFVGIGATTPLSGELFSIQKGQNGSTFMRIYNSTSNNAACVNYIANANGAGISMSAYSTAYTSSGIYQAGTGVINAGNTLNLGTNTSNPLNFWTNNTQRMTLSSGGNLGIGNTSPAYPLDVTGSVHIPSGNYYYAGTMGGGTPAYLGLGFDGVNSIINASGSALLLNYYSSKDVDICTGPAQGYVSTGNNFEIGAPTRDVNTALNIKANGTRGINLSNSSGSSVFQVDNAGNITMASGSHIDFNNGDGYHGIGQYGGANPTFAGVDVNGPVVFGFAGGALGSNAFGTKSIALQWTSGGLVKIGGLTPASSPYVGALLTVNGTMVAREIYVETSDWADYVFKKDYKLMPLNDVEKYIASNKHLPNVPSANDVETKGQNLGQLQITQMEKTEELYLYLIEMNKKMEALTEQNKKLTEEVNALKQK